MVWKRMGQGLGVLLIGAILGAGCSSDDGDDTLSVAGSYLLTLINRVLSDPCLPAQDQFLPEGAQVQWDVIQTGNQLQITDSLQGETYQGILNSDNTFEATLTNLLSSQVYTGRFTSGGLENGRVQINIPSINCVASYDFAGVKQ